MQLTQHERQRRRRERARERGDAAKSWRGSGETCARWAEASKSDLRDLHTAVKNGQLDPDAAPEHCAALAAGVISIIHQPNLSHRLGIAVARVMLAMDRVNLERSGAGAGA